MNNRRKPSFKEYDLPRCRAAQVVLDLPSFASYGVRIKRRINFKLKCVGIAMNLVLQDDRLSGRERIKLDFRFTFRSDRRSYSTDY